MYYITNILSQYYFIMTIEILFCLIAVVSALALFFLQTHSVDSENVAEINKLKVVTFHQIGLQTVCKEVIMAMAQRNIYQLVEQTDEVSCDDGGGGDDDQWTSDLMVSSCNKLDAYEINVLELEQIVNVFCDQVEKIIDMYQVSAFFFLLLL